MRTKKALEIFQSHQKRLTALRGISALLSWDQATHLPAQAGATRSEQIGELAGIIHTKETGEKYVEAVMSLHEQADELSSVQQRSVALAKKELDITLSLDEEFVQRFEKLKSDAQIARQKAKQEDDFATFAPFLKEIFALSSEYAERVDAEKDPYDVLLDIYEENMTQKKYDELLLPLRKPLVELVSSLPQRETDTCYQQKIEDRHQLEKFVRDLVEQIGFDFSRGEVGVVEHPFAIKLGNNDQRINYAIKNILESTYLTIHELGHGLYEMYTDSAYERSHLSGGVSLGIHESQSRLLENMIGKSKPGVSFVLSKLKNVFPACHDWTEEGVYQYINHVQPSLIRTEADEVTYNLHILLRYELEKALMQGELQVDDLPDAWNQKMEEYLGVVPETDRQGCLQDVHWSMGSIGYFPTYMLGNIIGAQLREAFTAEHTTWGEQVAKGDFSAYRDWFDTHIWQHGSRYTPKELINKAIGSDLSSQPFIDYLHSKYAAN